MNHQGVDPFDGFVALCNAGTVYVQRHYYKEGQTFFRDAMKELQSTNVQNTDDTSSTYRYIKNEIYRVNQLTKTEPKREPMSSPFHVHIFTDDDDPYPIETEHGRLSCTNKVLMVKLSAVSLTRPTSADAIEFKRMFLSAIALQNMASTFLCLFLHNQSYPNGISSSCNKILEGAYKLYCSSETILWNLVTKQDPDLLPEVVASLTVVVRNQMNTTFHLGWYSKHCEAQEKMICVRQLIRKLSSLGFFKNESNPAASA